MSRIDEIRRALGSHARQKLVLSVGLTLFFCAFYFGLQRLAVFPVRSLPVSRIDDAVPFTPGWVWVYQSVYLLLSVVPWMSSSRVELTRYARGFVLLSSAAFIIFFSFPTAGPRPDAVPTDPMFRFLVSYDAPLNAFPSLHVGLSVYTVLFAWRMARSRFADGVRCGLMAPLVLWVAAIAFASIATKQHYAVDLPAGALLAWLCDLWSWNTNVSFAFTNPWRQLPGSST